MQQTILQETEAPTKSNQDTKNKELLIFNKRANFDWLYLDYIIEKELDTVDVIMLEFDIFACLRKFYIKNYTIFFIQETILQECDPEYWSKSKKILRKQ